MIQTKNAKREYIKAQPMQIGKLLKASLVERGWDGKAYMLCTKSGKLAMAYKAPNSPVFDVVKEF